MPRVVVPRSAKQAFVSAFGAVPPLLAADAARRGAKAPRGERAGWFLMAGVHALPGAYFADGFLRPRARMTESRRPSGCDGRGARAGAEVRRAASRCLGARRRGGLRLARLHPLVLPARPRALGGAGGRGDASAGPLLRRARPRAGHVDRPARPAYRAAVLSRQLVPAVHGAGRRNRLPLAGGRGDGRTRSQGRSGPRAELAPGLGPRRSPAHRAAFPGADQRRPRYPRPPSDRCLPALGEYRLARLFGRGKSFACGRRGVDERPPAPRGHLLDGTSALRHLGAHLGEVDECLVLGRPQPPRGPRQLGLVCLIAMVKKASASI